jgi:Transmembrane domain of unknown function (DUF3566)
VTTSGGTPRPTPAEAQGPGMEDRGYARASGSPNGGNPPPSPLAERQTGAYDVAAALRAQATRAAQATRSAAQRVQEAMTPTPLAEREDATKTNGAASPPPTVTPASPAASPTTDPTATPAGPVASPAGPAATGPAAVATPAQAYATGPGPATAARPVSRPPDTATEVARPRTAPAPTPRRAGRVRKARLRLLRLDPWSVMKTAFLLSVAVGIMLFVAVAVLWSVLDAAGVFAAVGDVVRDVTASETSPGIDIEGFVAMSRVLGFTTLVAVVDVVLVTALATLGAFLYNLSASLLGGLEVTLAEDD